MNAFTVWMNIGNRRGTGRSNSHSLRDSCPQGHIYLCISEPVGCSVVMHPALVPILRWIIVSACGVLAACDGPKTSRRPLTSSPFVVDVLPVQPRPFREALSATGTLVAHESVQVQAERAGVVKEISFEEGRPAKAGEVLVTMDDSELQAQLARARAQLDLASALETRHRNLLETKGISAADFDQTRANLAIANAEVKLIESQIAKTRIRAPFDGVAGLRHASVGTYLTPGTPVCSFQDVNSLKIDFSLPERYLTYIKAGQSVSFRVAGRSEKFEAKVAAIEPTVEVQTRSLLIRAKVPNENAQLLPGSFVEVEVVLEEIPDAILIPALALVPGLQQQTVFIHREGQVEERQVQAGLRTADAVQIVEGLKAGEEVITSGILQLRPGMKVQVNRIPRSTAPAQKASSANEPVPSGA